ncbi:DUF6188 family protein [Mycobacterium sp. MYCO198283]|uniref:DUF6188 family protein n=1 Tax=Mycobacterium sp. MYCO198283 TaxID=2883505 RepID=UPI0035ABF9EC
MIGEPIRSASVKESGELVIVFGSGVCMEVEIDPHHESCNVSGPRGFLVVCLAGGELATR